MVRSSKSVHQQAEITGDINNDGYVDIITTGYDKLNVLLGDAAGAFTNTYTIDISQYLPSNGLNPIDQLELKDVNNDGKLDLIVNLPIDGSSPTVFTIQTEIQSDPVLVFLNQGNGQFATANVLPLAAKSDGFVTGDFNGDGKLDILVRSDITAAAYNQVYPLTLYTGDGTGNFSQQLIAIPGIDTSSYFNFGLQMAAGDFNGDGRSEVVFNLNDRLSVYGYDTTNTWSELYRDSSDF
jgi:enediyne biosynthesis protein E4